MTDIPSFKKFTIFISLGLCLKREKREALALTVVCQVLYQWPCGNLLCPERPPSQAGQWGTPGSILVAVGSPLGALLSCESRVSGWLPTRLPARASKLINHTAALCQAVSQRKTSQLKMGWAQAEGGIGDTGERGKAQKDSCGLNQYPLL